MTIHVTNEMATLTLTGMGKESKKRCSSLEQPRGNFYKTYIMAGEGVKITQFISIFTSKRFWNLKKKQLKKSDPTKTFVFVRAENALFCARQGITTHT